MEQATLNWYALKVFYGKVFEFEDRLERFFLLDGALPDYEIYIPVQRIMLKGPEYVKARKKLAETGDGRCGVYEQVGPVVYKRVPVVNSLLFIRCEEITIKRIVEGLRPSASGISLIGVSAMVYLNPDRTAPATIPDKQVEMFRLVVSEDKGMKVFAESDMVNYKVGNKVRVLEGPLKGAEGYIKRIKGDRRLLVAIEGFIAVATSYIPPQFLETIKEDAE